MNFGDAIKELRTGRKVFRVGWDGIEGWLVQVDKSTCEFMHSSNDETLYFYTAESSPFIGMMVAGNKLAPYTPTQADMLADDWLIAESATIAGR